MIHDVFGGDMFKDAYEDNTATLVVTVNCKGVMGKGVAKTCKELYPYNSQEYINSCKNNPERVWSPGCILQVGNIIFFATKNHWRNPSRISWIRDGLPFLKKCTVPSYMCIPPLGCGNGGLAWSEVYPLIVQNLHDAKFDVKVYHPKDTTDVVFSRDGTDITWF